MSPNMRVGNDHGEPCTHTHLGGPVSTRSIIYTAAVALAVVVAYDKYGKRS